MVLSDVVAGYATATVLRGLSLSVGPGEVVTLVGRNGAGKSTAAHVACGMLRPRSGTVRVADRRMKGDGYGERSVSLCPQECALFPALTIRENLSTFAALGITDRSQRAQQVERSLERLDCLSRADQVVASLSGGWKKRANVAAALVGRARLLVLDEPTEAVDEATRDLIAVTVREAATEGIGCLVISHDYAFVEKVSDRIGLVVNGKLAMEGTGRELMRRSFGSSQFLDVRFDTPLQGTEAEDLRKAGLNTVDNGAAWRFVGRDPVARARSVDAVIERNGGSITVRRPGLADLVASVEGVAA